MKMIKLWFDKQDEQEKSAIVAFGIGMPAVLIIVGVTLWILKGVEAG